MSEDWPTPQRPEERRPLPRPADLPRGDGYDAEAVEGAFAAFYEHLAQLDSTLRTLESVETFRHQAGELRADLRSIRVAGWSPYPRGYPVAPTPTVGAGLPAAVPRIALEVAFLIVVAVVVAVASFSTWEIVAVMGLAFVIAAGAEFVAGRERAPLTRPVAPAEPPPALDEPVVEPVVAPAAEEEELEPVGWAAFAEPSGPEALTVMGAVTFDEPEAETDAEPLLAAEPAPGESTAEFEGPVPDVEGEAAEQAPEPEPVVEDEVEAEPEAVAEEPEPVAELLEPEPVAEEPEPVAEEPEPVAEKPEPVAELPEPEPVAEEPEPVAEPAEPELVPEPHPARRFWRRRHEPEPEAAEQPEPAAVAAVEDEEPEAEPEPEPELEPAAAAEAEPEPARVFEEEPVLIEDHTDEGPRRRWAWRRRMREPVQQPEPVVEPVKHVRVLPPPEPVLERDLDPWERGFDFDIDEDAVPLEDEAQDEVPLRRPPR